MAASGARKPGGVTQPPVGPRTLEAEPDVSLQYPTGG